MSADSSLRQKQNVFSQHASKDSGCMKVRGATTRLAPGLPDDHLHDVSIIGTAQQALHLQDPGAHRLHLSPVPHR